MLTVAAHVTQPVTVNGRQWWLCPACGQRLAEIVDGRVEIKSGLRWIIFDLANTQRQRCPSPRCGEWSVLRMAA